MISAVLDVSNLNRNVHSYNTRKNHDLHLQNLQTTVGKKITKFKASQLWNQLLVRSKKLNLKVYLNPGSKFTYIINYILNDYDQ